MLIKSIAPLASSLLLSSDRWSNQNAAPLLFLRKTEQQSLNLRTILAQAHTQNHLLQMLLVLRQRYLATSQKLQIGKPLLNQSHNHLAESLRAPSFKGFLRHPRISGRIFKKIEHLIVLLLKPLQIDFLEKPAGDCLPDRQQVVEFVDPTSTFMAWSYFPMHNPLTKYFHKCVSILVRIFKRVNKQAVIFR